MPYIMTYKNKKEINNVMLNVTFERYMIKVKKPFEFYC